MPPPAVLLAAATPSLAPSNRPARSDRAWSFL